MLSFLLGPPNVFWPPRLYPAVPLIWDILAVLLELHQFTQSVEWIRIGILVANWSKDRKQVAK
jgi:hypothetical protein